MIHSLSLTSTPTARDIQGRMGGHNEHVQRWLQQHLQLDILPRGRCLRGILHGQLVLRGHVGAVFCNRRYRKPKGKEAGGAGHVPTPQSTFNFLRTEDVRLLHFSSCPVGWRTFFLSKFIRWSGSPAFDHLDRGNLALAECCTLVTCASP